MPYRSDDVALNDRREQLEEQLNAIRARAKELGDVRAEEQRTIAELDAIRRRIGASRRLPMLDNVRVASPCKASWDEMAGDEQARFCGKCEKNVYNLSAMTREAAERLLVEKEGRMCVRFFQRPDGTVMTADCPVGVRRKRVRRVALAAVGGGFLAAAAATMTSRQGAVHATLGAPESFPVMGAMPVTMGQMPVTPVPTATPTAKLGEMHVSPPGKHAKPR